MMWLVHRPLIQPQVKDETLAKLALVPGRKNNSLLSATRYSLRDGLSATSEMGRIGGICGERIPCRGWWCSCSVLSSGQQKIFYAAFNNAEVLENLALTWLKREESLSDSINVLMAEVEDEVAAKVRDTVHPLVVDLDNLH